MITRALIAIGLLLAAAGAGWSYGHSNGYASGYQAATKADKQTIADARKSATDAHAAVADVRTKLADARRNYRLAMQAAKDAIATRDAEVARLRQGLQFKLDEINHAAKQWQDCEALAHDPVCAPVADKLWPAAAASTAARTAGD